MNDPRELELGPETMRAMVDEAMRHILAHIASLPSQPANGAADQEAALVIARTVREPLPETGVDFRALFQELFQTLVPPSFNTAGPGYLAYIPGGGLFHAAVADLIAGAINRYVGLWAAAPALADLETTVGGWLTGMIGYPEGSRGIFTTGGSMANLIALVTARHERLPEDFLRGRIYVSEQVHHSVTKAARFAGFPEAACVRIPTDDDLRLDVAALAEAVRADRRAGHTPFFVVGSVGTTNTGAVDDLEAIADVAAEERLWMHVDAAYGGFFVLTGEGRRRMRGIERSDSVTLDPHKALFLPYGNGALVVRDGSALRRAHGQAAEYLPDMQSDPDRVDACELSPELSRDFRGLRIWLPLKMHGAPAFRAALEEKLSLARMAADELRRMPSVTLVAEPQLSLLAFRASNGGTAEDGDELTRRWLAATNARQRVFLTSTVVRGRFVIRMCILSFRTHEERVRMALEDLAAALAEVSV